MQTASRNMARPLEVRKSIIFIVLYFATSLRCLSMIKVRKAGLQFCNFMARGKAPPRKGRDMLGLAQPSFVKR